jgi:hypothetical protein
MIGLLPLRETEEKTNGLVLTTPQYTQQRRGVLGMFAATFVDRKQSNKSFS